MDVMEAIQTRRSVRKYSSRPIEEEKLNLVLEAARRSPSATNAQNWRFIVVRDKEKLQKLMEAADGQPSVGEAPCAIVACGTKKRIMDCGQPTDTVDCAIAMSYMILEAHELGLGTCWLGHFYADKVKKTLRIPEDVSVIAFTPLGYPAEEPEPRPRKELKEIVSYEKY
ncbi:Nitroreductase [Sporobacter termitidis DSM 10068]|uniref:Nitroreductase n=1 Tax=Sporobacter termitidis DSM 10068 TaxID=1123282 RepID=A0A1M5Z9C6_9FIRM|nr:nitroreductase family protein [Sporobacter termitidis]SHI20814.1 Nitroreductase [Sporobacter termitidis DSM 10068]